MKYFVHESEFFLFLHCVFNAAKSNDMLKPISIIFISIALTQIFLTFTQSDIVMVRYNEEAIRCIAESDILSSYVRMHVREMCLKNASVEMCSMLYYFCRSERNLIFKGILKHMNTSQMSNGFAQIPSGFSNMSIIYQQFWSRPHRYHLQGKKRIQKIHRRLSIQFNQETFFQWSSKPVSLEDFELAQYDLIFWKTDAKYHSKERGQFNKSLVTLEFTFKRQTGFFLLQVGYELVEKRKG